MRVSEVHTVARMDQLHADEVSLVRESAHRRRIETLEQRNDQRRDERAAALRKSFLAAQDRDELAKAARLRDIGVHEVSILSAPLRPANRRPILLTKAEEGAEAADIAEGEAAADAELAVLRAAYERNSGLRKTSELFSVLNTLPSLPDNDLAEPTSRAPLTKQEQMDSNAGRFIAHTAGLGIEKSFGGRTLEGLANAIADAGAMGVRQNDLVHGPEAARGIWLRKNQWAVNLMQGPLRNLPEREALAKMEQSDPESFARLCVVAGVRGVVVSPDGARERLAKLRQIHAPMSTTENYKQFRQRISRSIAEEQV